MMNCTPRGYGGWIFVLAAIFQQRPVATSVAAPKICQTKRNGQIFKISNSIMCNNMTVKSMRIELSKSNIREYKVPAKSILVESNTCKTETSFFNVKTKDLSSSTKFIPKEMAYYLITNKLCLEGDGKYVPFTPDKPISCRYQWMKQVSTVTYICKFHVGQVLSSHSGFLKSDLGDLHLCDYLNGHCIQQGLHIFWDPDTRVAQDFVPMGIFNATKVGNHLLVNKLGLSFVLNDMIYRHDVYQNDVFKIKVLPSRLQTDLLLDLKDGSIEERFTALQEELAHKFQFLMDILSTPDGKLSILCEALAQSNKLAMVLANTNPTQIAQLLLNRTDLIAKATQDYIMVFPCETVKEVIFNAENNSCYNYVPVKYKKKDKSWSSGFLNPRTLMISFSANEIKCGSVSTELFKLWENLYMYIPGHNPFRVNTKKSTVLSVMNKLDLSKFDDIPTEWAFGKKDFHTVDIDVAVRSNIQQKLNEFAEESGITQATPQWLGFLAIKTLTPMGLLNAFCTWTVRIITAVLFLDYIRRTTRCYITLRRRWNHRHFRPAQI